MGSGDGATMVLRGQSRYFDVQIRKLTPTIVGL
jgi:hypothetical protein